ncbi:hypothetical protein ACFXJ8_39040 [Nonomuraea sp. NPDC059194]|uniref:hypothetical protein n=1 Tax=Nonomuraea sp. NPDC059194 TaxID=3346764 RepID=UPI0036855016
MDELQAVKDLLTVPPPTPDSVRAGRARLRAALADSARPVAAVGARPGAVRPAVHPAVRRGRRAARWSTLAIGLVGAAAAAALVLFSAPAPTTQTVLLSAATRVAQAPDEGAWWTSKLVNGRIFPDPTGRYLLRQTESEQVALPADPEGTTWDRRTYLGAVALDEAAWKAAGSPTSWTYPSPPGLISGRQDRAVSALPGQPVTHSTEDWDFRVVLADKPLTKLAEVPATPEGLRGLFGDNVQAVARLIFYAPVTSETRAAGYRLLAQTSGVSVAGEVTDPLGRRGQAIEYGEPDGSRVRLTLDEASGAPLALETLRDGRVVEFTAIESSSWTNDNPLKEQQ